MKTSLVTVAALAILLATPVESEAGGYRGHGHGGGHWGGYGGGRYWGGHSGNYYGGAWPFFGLGMVLGAGLGGAWARDYPVYYPYPPVPVYAYPPPPQACGTWVWDEPGYAWIWEACGPGPAVVVPRQEPQIAPQHQPEVAVPRG